MVSRSRSRSRSKRRRRRRDDSVAARAILPVVLLVALGVAAFVLIHPVSVPKISIPTIPACPPVADVTVGPYLVPAGPVAGYCQSQLVNAAQVLRAAQSYGLSVHGEEIGVMTAIGESSLRNVDYGDTAGPDSRGIFQQRSNYGALANRMDPYTAARAFFQRMQGIVDWPALAPTVVAHTVQRNADPDYYTQYWPAAVKVVTALNKDMLPAAVPVPTS
jgi:hypothetical protein